MNEEVQIMWRKYLQSIGEEIETTKMSYRSDYFDTTLESSIHLMKLIIEGKKRATTGCLWSYEYDKEEPYKNGDLTIVTDMNGKPGCIIRTKSSVIKKFNEITVEDAQKEGEGDCSYEYWKKVHLVFCQNECERIGRVFNEEIPVVFEEFEVVYK